MTEVETRVDARSEDLLEQVMRVLKDVGMHAIGECQAVHNDMYVRIAEVSFDQV